MKNSLPWWKSGILYQIYPRSFADSNSDGIGDLNGIRSRLDYLADLGVNGLWLSPIFPSPDVDFGYDVSDFCSIDPKYGTMEDFDALLEDAHRIGMRIILDMVMNHTSDQHPWFQRASSSRDDPYHDWYLWKHPAADGKEPNNWRSVTGGSGWEYVPAVDRYYFHMFYKQQPDLNWRNQDLQDEMLRIFRFWLDKGVDGYRLDVFNLFYKDEAFRNNPPKFGLRPFDQQNHIYDVNRPEMLPFLEKIRKIADEKPGRYLVGEPFTASSPIRMMNIRRSIIAARYCGDKLLHATFCFDLLHSPWNAVQFRKAIQEWENALNGKAWPTYVLGNHDNPRLASRYGDDDKDSRCKAAAVILLTLRGTPFVYYGDEIGMRDISLKREQIKDPVGLRYWPIYKGRDGCRAPMQWSDDEQAGFTNSTQPWLPVHPDYAKRNVERQSQSKNSLLNLYKQLVQLRSQHRVFLDGELKIIDGLPPAVLGYLRSGYEEKAMVLVNFSQKRIFLPLPEGDDATWSVLLSSQPAATNPIINNQISLKANEAVIFISNPVQR